MKRRGSWYISISCGSRWEAHANVLIHRRDEKRSRLCYIAATRSLLNKRASLSRSLPCNVYRATKNRIRSALVSVVSSAVNECS